MAGDNRQRDKYSIEFKIGEKDIGYYCDRFEWVCFINAGHRITATFTDNHNAIFTDEFIKELFKKTKDTRTGVDITVRVYQDFNRGKGKKTQPRKFKLLTLSSQISGTILGTTLEIVAIDAASWKLNQGKCSGEAYKGNISSVIKQIVKKHAEGINPEVDETNDTKEGIWYDMRLDPKTVISSLIEWSSAVTNNKTPMVVHCEDQDFKCREWANLPPTKNNNKKFIIDTKYADRREISSISDIKVLSNNFLSPAATRLHVASISATSGLYIDKGNDDVPDRKKLVKDEFTGQKLMPKVKSDQSYKKSTGESSTFIEPIPEHNNGDVGIKYQDYIIGRAKDWFIRILYTTLRIKVMIDPGDTDFDSVYGCGRDKIILDYRQMQDGGAGKPHYLNGNWMLYGFRHIADKYSFTTELLLSRLDHNAIGKTI